MLTFPVLPGLTFTVVKTPEFNTLDQVAPNFYSVRIAQSINPFWHWTFIFDVLRDYTTAGYNTITETRMLLGFFNSMRGKQGSFLYTDPTDNSVGPARLTTAWQAHLYVQVGTGVLDSANHWQQVQTAGTTGSTIPTFNHAGSTTTDGTAIWLDMGTYSSAGFPNLLASLPIVNDGAGNYYSPLQRTLSGLDWEDVTDLAGALGAVYANGVLKTPGTDYTGPFGPGLGLPLYSYMGMYIKWAAPPLWQTSHAYALAAQILDPNGHIQQVSLAGTSGGSIPVFNATGGVTYDSTLLGWQVMNTYAPADQILDYAGHIQHTSTGGTSGGINPVFNHAGGFTYEGWRIPWQTSYVYALGKQILDSAGHIQQVTTAGTSGVPRPVFNDSGSTTTDNTVVWQDEGFIPAWVAGNTYALGTNILDPAGHIQQVTTAGTSGGTIPTFNDLGSNTTDNTVVWLDLNIMLVWRDNGQVLTWQDGGYNSGPVGPITTSFNFYFRVRFEMDDQDFEQFMQYLWTIGGSEGAGGRGSLKLCTARPTPL